MHALEGFTYKLGSEISVEKRIYVKSQLRMWIREMTHVTPKQLTLREGRYKIIFPPTWKNKGISYKFWSWENGEKNPTRILDLTDGMNIKAIYEPISHEPSVNLLQYMLKKIEFSVELDKLQPTKQGLQDEFRELKIEVMGDEKFRTAKEFLSRFFEIGFQGERFSEERKVLIETMEKIKSPHKIIMACVNELLQKIADSYQIDLHGAKEYSGVDICKKYRSTILGFQIKSRNNKVSEDRIRSQATKARQFRLNGYVLMYAMRRTNKVDVSISAAYHHFRNINESRDMYCVVVQPELLAELFRKYKISI